MTLFVNILGLVQGKLREDLAGSEEREKQMTLTIRTTTTNATTTIATTTTTTITT